MEHSQELRTAMTPALKMIVASSLDFTLFTSNYICLTYIGIDCNVNTYCCLLSYIKQFIIINIHVTWHSAIECTWKVSCETSCYLDPYDWKWLEVCREPGNVRDRSAVCIKKGGAIAGHVPRVLTAILVKFIDHGATSAAG